MERVFDIVRKVADSEAAVLITGESGTGKELVARSIHAHSGRRDAPFVAINCAAIPRDLLESELFGHVKGAFTGAVKDKTGRFELAEGGHPLPGRGRRTAAGIAAQAAAGPCRSKVVEPVGGTKAHKLDVRLVAATNLDMEKAAE